MSVIYYPGYSQQQITENLLCRDIASISNSCPMVVETVLPHGYVAGMMVTFLIPIQYGMEALNGVNVQVIELISDTELSINFDSRQMTPFAYPSPLPNAYTPASIVPSASGPYLSPQPLPYGNEISFEGIIYNNGIAGDPINGI